MPVQEVHLEVIRTGRDINTREVWIEHRTIWVTSAGASYYPNPDDAEGWRWAFGGDISSVRVDEHRKGYTRYYGTNKEVLLRQFLDSRNEAVEAAKAALVGAEQILTTAEKFCQEVIHGQAK